MRNRAQVAFHEADRGLPVARDEIAAEVAAEYPDVQWDKMLVDAMTMRMTLPDAETRTAMLATGDTQVPPSMLRRAGLA